VELSGKAAVVTGAARGIGRGIAVALARSGADVVVADLVGDPGLAAEAEQTKAAVEATGRAAHVVECDVRDRAQVDALVDATVDRFGRVDVGVANAGVVRPAPLTDPSTDAWDLTLDVNLTGTYLLAKALTPRFVEQRSGVFLAVSSIAAFRGGAGYTAYCTSKAGVLGFVRAMATELAPYDVRANALCPGHLETAMWRDEILPDMGGDDPDAQFRDVIAAAVPLGRPQTPDDIGRAAVYLCEADNVTGEHLVVDGGHTAGP
jgi:meso-butanediol dehydrogenase / (S,S)-butanediol dehydrogenase / diacetyl reductase